MNRIGRTAACSAFLSRGNNSYMRPDSTSVITPVAMGRREIFRAHPYRAEFPFAGDFDFQARVADEWKMAILPDVLLRYRWYTDQTTQQCRTSIEQSRCVIQIAAGRRRLRRPENSPRCPCRHLGTLRIRDVATRRPGLPCGSAPRLRRVSSSSRDCDESLGEQRVEGHASCTPRMASGASFRPRARAADVFHRASAGVATSSDLST